MHELSERRFSISIPDLVRFAAASGDFNPIHYDRGRAEQAGLPGVILPGLLKAAWLGELAIDSTSEDWRLEEFEVSYRGLDVIGQEHSIHGQIAEESESSRILRLDGRNVAGNTTTIGTARFGRCAVD